MNNTADKKYMNKAIELAKNGKYRTHPNPLVGAVIVKNNKSNEVYVSLCNLFGAIRNVPTRY